MKAIRDPRLRSWAAHVAAPLVLVLVGLLTTGNDYVMHLATAAAIAYILTASFNLIYGYAGIFNLAIIMIYGIGAFTSVYLEVRYGLSFWIALPLSVLVTTAISVLIALPSKGLNELFLAIETLAFALATSELLLRWESFSGGTIGVYIIPSPTLFGTTLLGGEPEYYWLAAVGAWLAYEVGLRLHRGALGRKFVALREGPRVLASVGVSPGSTRLVAFAISGALAGLAGVLYAHFQMVISLETFSFGRLVALLLATILGGAGFLLGPVFGVLTLLLMDELSLATSQAQDLVYGLGILALVALSRGGVAGVLHRFWRRFVPTAVSGALSPVPVPTGKAPASVPVHVLEQAENSGERAARTLTATGVSVSFGGTQAVRDMTVTLRTGEVVGLIGPNGAGKTSLLNAVTGDVRTDSGTIRLDSDDLLGRRQEHIVRAGIGRTFQSPHLIADLTVVENVMLGREVSSKAGWLGQALHSPASKRDDREAYDRAMGLLADFALTPRALQRAGDQPYGVLRLVEVARNLMLNPSFLLLDEPGAGLTEAERDEVSATIRALRHRDIGVLLVDHNLPLISSACDRVYVMDGGRLIADGTPGEVFAHADVISAYLGVPG